MDSAVLKKEEVHRDDNIKIWLFHKINFLSKRKPQDFHGNYGLGAQLPIAGLLDTDTHTSPPNTFKTALIEKVNNFPVNRKFSYKLKFEQVKNQGCSDF